MEPRYENKPYHGRIVIRHILYKSRKKRVPLVQEVDFILHYVGIERIRHWNNISIVFAAQGNIAGLSIEALLLLPFVENAFRHDARETLVPAEVSIVIFVQDKELRMQARNTKPAPVKEGESETGIGLENMMSRLRRRYLKPI